MVGDGRACDTRAVELTAEQIRVLACLIEKEAAVPDSYPLTASALRLACNQSTNRRPVVAYDDRTVDTALVGLKSVGLVRFMHPSHGGRTIRYRHTAGERWHLDPGELLVLSALALRGPQTANEVATRVERLLPPGAADVADLLDTLTARSPEPLAQRLEKRPGERDHRWVATLGGDLDTLAATGDEELIDSTTDLPRVWITGTVDAGSVGDGGAEVGSPNETVDAGRGANESSVGEELAALRERVEELAAVIGAVASRLDRLERDLGS